jgi:hypothetical protein
LPLEIYSRLKRGITPEINAISTVILIGPPFRLVLRRAAAGTRFHESPRRGPELATAAIFLLMLTRRWWRAPGSRAGKTCRN